MDTLIDVLLVVLAVILLLGVNFLVYAIVSRKMLTINLKITRAIWLGSSALVTLVPFLVPIRVDTLEQMGSMKFGFPAYFVEQHFFAVNTDIAFPFYTTLANPFGYSIRTAISINPLSYAVDVLIGYAVCAFVFQMLKKTTLKTDHGIEA